MMTFLRTLLATSLLAAAHAVAAHEFWVHVQPAAPAAGASAGATLHVGEYFIGDLVGVTASHAAAVRLYSKAGVADLGKSVPATSMLRSLPLSFPRPGTYVLAYESHPSEVVLPADKFHDYLRQEGLDAIIRQREAAGTAGTPGRERFRRSAKALVAVGGRPDASFAVATAQRLEITPVVDPLSASPGETVRFMLKFDGKPLAGALLKAWHGRGVRKPAVQSVSDAQGQVALQLPKAGLWLLNAVHMVPVTDSAVLDWDSFWGSLTFELPGASGR